MQPVLKSAKLGNVCYDIRGPVLARAKQMEDEGQRITKLNIGNPAPFGFLAPDEIDIAMDFDSPRKAGVLGLGTGCAVVMDETADIPAMLGNIVRFFSRESCGQCTHCREGTTWMAKMLARLLAGGCDGREIDLLRQLADTMGMMPGMSICGLADGCAWPVRTAIDKFRDEFEAKCRRRTRLPVGILAPLMHADGRG